MKPRPEMPKPRQETPKPPTVAIALMVLFLISAGLIGIVAIVLPGVLLMVIAGLGLLLMFVAQYFLWGVWLYPIVVRMEQRKDETRGIVSDVDAGDSST